MLELKDIQKTYRSKKGTSQEALRGIDLSIGDKGFIVLLGKSGSGKSTLLNIIGGLDRFDDGEIIIKGKSTRDFNRNEWDAYRNTYVGFVFQEFYIIDDFTVGKNIALALELQGYPKEQIKNRVKNILKDVDLEGYENRKPNEISSGQKQRIAIARALVKDSQIILVDEPTGNLDSETGKIILDTLKQLSQDKLIIMVTHDEEFAYRYGDRIIEMKDGVITRDLINTSQVKESDIVQLDQQQLSSVMNVSTDKQLTQEMISHINQQLLSEDREMYVTIIPNEAYLDSLSPNIIFNTIEVDEKDIKEHLEESVQDEFRLKQSSLSWKSSYHLAITNLFTRKIRFFFMSLLFIISLLFVGVATTFSFYDVSKASLLTFEQKDVTSIPFSKYQKCYSCDTEERSLMPDEINQLEKKFTGIEFMTTIKLELSYVSLRLQGKGHNLNYMYYANGFSGLTFTDGLKHLLTLSQGDYPSTGELLVTDYMAFNLIEQQVYEGVTKDNELIGKTMTYQDETLTISGIVDTDYERFDDLKQSVNHDLYESSGFITLKASYEYLYLTKETYETVFNQYAFIWFKNDDSDRMYSKYMMPANQAYASYLHGESRLPQNNNEVVMSVDMLKQYGEQLDYESVTDEQVNALLGKTYDIRIDAYDDLTSQKTKAYTLIGVLDSQEISSDYLFTKAEFDYFNYNNPSDYSNVKTRTLTGLLGSNDRENTKFILYLGEKNYRHKTMYSEGLYEVEYFTNQGGKFVIGAGVVFSLFASILIFTFISTGIKNKQKDIGTLRAIGARGLDVSKIYMIEGVIIALLSSVIANGLTTVVVIILNNGFRDLFNSDIVLLYVNGWSILFVFLFSFVVVGLSSFLPIKRITLMRPINAIKN